MRRYAGKRLVEHLPGKHNQKTHGGDDIPTGSREDVFSGLQKRYGADHVLKGKGSGFFVRGKGVMSLAKARKETGIKAPARVFRGKQLPWGDYATIAALAGKLKGGMIA